jgi:hypothetical protein
MLSPLVPTAQAMVPTVFENKKSKKAKVADPTGESYVATSSVDFPIQVVVSTGQLDKKKRKKSRPVVHAEGSKRVRSRGEHCAVPKPKVGPKPDNIHLSPSLSPLILGKT